MSDNKWIEDLRAKEAGYEISAPEGLWADIDSRLGAESAAHRRWPLPIWRRAAAVAAVAAVALIVGVVLYTHRAGIGMDEMASESMINIKAGIAGESNDMPMTQLQAVANVRQQSRHQVRDEAASVTVAEPFPDVSKPAATVPELECGDDDEQADDAEATSADAVTGSRLYAPMHGDHSMRHRDAAWPKPGVKRDWQLVTYVGNMIADGNNHATGRGLRLYQDASGMASDAVIGDNPMTDFATLNQNRIFETRAYHNIPLRLGVNIIVPLRGRWSIETGLTYSLLSSTFKSEAQSSLCETHQRQQYIGVPLRLGYELLRSERWMAYASAGGMIEKSVYGRSKTTLYVGDSRVNTTTASVPERAVQLSVSGALGLRYRLTRVASIFVEPGVSYYIDNHSAVSNSYKEHPLNFDLKLGVSISLE